MEIKKVNKLIKENHEQKLEILTKEELILIIKKYSINYQSMNISIIEKENLEIKKRSIMEKENLESKIQMLESKIQMLESNNKNLIEESEKNKADLKYKNNENIKERYISIITMIFLICILLYKTKKKEKY